MPGISEIRGDTGASKQDPNDANDRTASAGGDSGPEAVQPNITGDAGVSPPPSSPLESTVNPSVEVQSSPPIVSTAAPLAPSLSASTAPNVERQIPSSVRAPTAAITYMTSAKASVVSVRAVVPRAKATDNEAPELHEELSIDIKSTGAVYAVSGQRQAAVSEDDALLAELLAALLTPGLSSSMRVLYRIRIAILRVVKTRVFEAVIMAFIVWSCINLSLDSVGLHVRGLSLGCVFRGLLVYLAPRIGFRNVRRAATQDRVAVVAHSS